MYKKYKGVSKETLFVIASLTCMIAITVFTSVANAGLDPDKIFTTETLSNVLLNAAITIFGTISSVPAGIAGTKQFFNSDGTPGRYIQDFADYNTVRLKIEPKRYMFNQWHKEQYKKECRDKCISYLLENGIVQAEQILDLSREQVLSLGVSSVFEVNGNKVYYKALTPAQISASLRVLEGKVKVHKLSDYYFLYANGKGSKTFYEQAHSESKDESSTIVLNLITRIFSGLIITCIFTGLVTDSMALTGSTPEETRAIIFKMIINMVARIFNAISSTIWGYLIGKEHTYKLCYYLNGRTQFLQAFDTDREFVYKDLQQSIAEEIASKEAPNGNSSFGN